MPLNSSSFIVGETVNMRVRVNAPGTRRPVDASTVVLSSLKQNGTPVTVSPNDFSKVGTGEYLLGLDTDGFTPGTYDVRVTVTQSPSGVVMIEDRFVLKAA